MSDSYTLVVSRGYARLVHKNGPESLARRARRRAQQWVPDDDYWTESCEPEEPWDEDPEDIPDWADLDFDPEAQAYLAEQADLEAQIEAHLAGYDPVEAQVEAHLAALAEEEKREAGLVLVPGRGDDGLSRKSRNNMRRLFNSLPLELLGPRPALISLTYPGDWKRWVPDGRAWERQRRNFSLRWSRQWKEPLIGVWVKEFQESGRPHLHLYVGLPGAMSDEDFAGLRERTLLRHRLERRYGRYEGRGKLPAISQQYGGEFAMWLRTAWSEVVGTQGKVQAHHARGADVAVMFFSDEAAEKADRTAVADYLAREAAKWRQKKPPAGFMGVGRYFGYWGRNHGFVPQVQEVAVNPLVAMEMGSRLQRWVNWKLHVLRNGAPPATSMDQRRPWDGITAFGLRPEQSMRILAWSEKAAARKVERDPRWGSGGEAPGEVTKLLRSVDVATGEVVSVEEGSGPVEDAGVHRLQIAPHGGSRVGVAEDSLDVQEVEVVRSVVGGGVVEDSSGATAEVVRGDVAESGSLGPVVDDVEEGPSADGVVPVESSGSALAGSSEHLAADERRVRPGIGIDGEVAADGVAEGSSGGRLARLAPLAGPGDGGQVAEVVDGEATDLGEAHSEEAQPDDDLVA